MTSITDITDPRVAPYVNVVDPRSDESTTHFLVESENVVKRFLASDFECESVLCADHKADRFVSLVKPGTALLTADRRVVNDIMGYKFHSGVMALGRRKIDRPVDDLVSNEKPCTLVVLPELTDPTNIGAIIRTAAAFGATGVLLGEQCRDPFIRQTIRISMGTIFYLPIIRTLNIRADLIQLRDSHNVQLCAGVLTDNAISLRDARPKPRRAILFGNEGSGLEPDIVSLCDLHVTIPMQLGTDSLNVAACAAVMLYAFNQG